MQFSNKETVKKQVAETLKNKKSYQNISGLFIDWFCDKKAKSESDLAEFGRHSESELMKSIDYWKSKHIFTEEQFIENLKYSNLSATSLANIVKAANEIADAKTEDEISKLEAEKRGLEEEHKKSAERIETHREAERLMISKTSYGWDLQNISDYKQSIKQQSQEKIQLVEEQQQLHHKKIELEARKTQEEKRMFKNRRLISEIESQISAIETQLMIIESDISFLDDRILFALEGIERIKKSHKELYGYDFDGFDIMLSKAERVIDRIDIYKEYDEQTRIKMQIRMINSQIERLKIELQNMEVGGSYDSSFSFKH